MKKKAVRALITIMLLACLMGSCKDPAALNPARPVTITIWHYYAPELASVIDEYLVLFNNTVGLEQGIVAQAVYMEGISNLTSDIMAASTGKIGASPLPDLVFVYKETAFELDRMGLLIDLNEYFSAEELDAYIPEYLLEGVNGEGRLLNFPVAKSTECLYLDVAAFEAFAQAANSTGGYAPVSTDMPATFEGLAEAADIYYRYTDSLTPDVPFDGKALFGIDSSANYFQAMIRQLGAQAVAQEEGRPVFCLDAQAARRLWQYYCENTAAGRMYKFSQYGSEDMKTGDIIAYIGSTGGARHFPTEALDQDGSYRKTELAVFPYPVLAGAQPAAVQQGAGISMIKTDEKRQQAAAIFLKWFTDTPQNTHYSFRSGYLPVKKNANTLTDEALAAIPAESTVDLNVRKVLSVAVQMTASYQFAITPEHTGVYETRNMYGDTLRESAGLAKARFSATLPGTSFEAALAAAAGEDAFQAWFHEIQAQFAVLTQAKSKQVSP